MFMLIFRLEFSWILYVPLMSSSGVLIHFSTESVSQFVYNMKRLAYAVALLSRRQGIVLFILFLFEPSPNLYVLIRFHTDRFSYVY